MVITRMDEADKKDREESSIIVSEAVFVSF